MNWPESGRLAIKMFEEAGVDFEAADNKIAVEETFIDLMNWADRNRDAADIASKLRDIHQLVSASVSFDMPR
jgi:hypothetical protein